MGTSSGTYELNHECDQIHIMYVYVPHQSVLNQVLGIKKNEYLIGQCLLSCRLMFTIASPIIGFFVPTIIEHLSIHGL